MVQEGGSLKVKQHPRHLSVYIVTLGSGEEKIATLNLSPGVKVYDEFLVDFEGDEFRVWNPYRSKLAAAIIKGLKYLPIKPGSKVLYLGAASGTTLSHVSDIVGEEGLVYGVEFSARPMRELIQNVAAYRRNVIPILEDARLPQRYRHIVGEVDVIYCDVAQPEQAKILADNSDLYLKDGGYALLAVKARSIDVTKKPKEVFEREIKVLEARRFRVEEKLILEPYDKDHIMVLSQKVK